MKLKLTAKLIYLIIPYTVSKSQANKHVDVL